ncbi:MAG: hypothetical protein ACKV2U_34390, partial [Bryobacteraceae bacterium]
DGAAPPTGPRRFRRVVNVRDPLWWAASLLLILMVACHAWLGIIYFGAIANPQAEAAELRIVTLPGFLLKAASVVAKADAQAAVDQLQPAADAGNVEAQYPIARTLLWEPGAIGRALRGPAVARPRRTRWPPARAIRSGARLSGRIRCQPG